MAPIYDWNGLYIGLQGGYGWGDVEWTFVGPGTIADHRTRGGLFGGTAGVNMQFGQWVFGIEGDYAWASISGAAVCPAPAFDCRSRLESFGTVRGRLGIAWDAFMVYGTGGVAFGDQNIRTVNIVTGAVGGSNVFKLGWTAGGGIEWGFAPGWSAKIEAQYFDLGTDRHVVTGPDPVDARHDGVIIRGGINWRFNWGPAAPIAARY